MNTSFRETYKELSDNGNTGQRVDAPADRPRVAHRRERRRSDVIGVIAASLIGLALLAAIIAIKGNQTVSVVATTAEPRAIAGQPSGSGRVTAAQDYPVSVGFGTTVQAARLTEVMIIEGQRVSKNDVLFKLELPDDAGANVPSTVVSPIDGTVASVSVLPGQNVTSGKVLAHIVDASRIRVAAAIPVIDRGAIAVGAPVTVRFSGQPGLELTGSVSAVSPRAVGTGQASPILVEADNPRGQALLGSTAYVYINVNRQAAIAIPRIAVMNIDRDRRVFVVDGGKLHSVAVTTGVADEKYVEITSGLTAGHTVALSGFQDAADGSKAKIIKVEH